LRRCAGPAEEACHRIADAIGVSITKGAQRKSCNSPAGQYSAPRARAIVLVFSREQSRSGSTLAASKIRGLSLRLIVQVRRRP
jgi:hypothetical protein